MPKKRSEPTWREFEKIVAIIEEAAAPVGAIVRSPDRIRDLTTGQIREVDASIRYSLGTVEILVTIEVRKRGRIADDTWIEQLATKRGKLGAAKTIAVSKKSFTKPAKITAKHHGIELRTLSEITPQNVAEWLRLEDTIHVIPEARNLTFSVKLDGNPHFIELIDSWEPRFFHDRVKSPFPALVLWEFHGKAYPRRFENLPLDGSITRVEFQISCKDPHLIPIPDRAPSGIASPLFIDLDASRREVCEVRVSADVSLHVLSLDHSSAQYHAYEGAEGMIAHHANFQGMAFGQPVKFDLASRGRDVAGFAEFPSGARLGISWIAKIPRPRTLQGTCAFCDRPTLLEKQYVLPDFLVPSEIEAKEHFLCSHCAKTFDQWDEYARLIWTNVPHDLTGPLPGVFTLQPIDGARIKLWLLSLLWRMGSSPALKQVSLGEASDEIRKLLKAGDISRPSRFPANCVALSAEGRRVEFFYPPHMRQFGDQLMLSAVFQGVLFQFLLGEDTSDSARLVNNDTWIFPVVDWRKVDFLVDAALNAKGGRH